MPRRPPLFEIAPIPHPPPLISYATGPTGGIGRKDFARDERTLGGYRPGMAALPVAAYRHVEIVMITAGPMTGPPTRKASPGLSKAGKSQSLARSPARSPARGSLLPR